MIEARGLGKRFGRQQVFHGLDFNVQAGEVVALSGSNGVGKTTLLRLLMGFLEPSEGHVRVLDEDPLARRRLAEIGWMPEVPAYPRTFTLGQVLSFQAATFPTWDSVLASELTQRLELDLQQRVDRVSRGQSARLALVLAVAHRPRLLILDDPTLGLDPKARRLLLGEVLAAAAESGAGVLIATHLIAEASRSLDRLMLLQDGRLEVDEDLEGLKARCRRLHVPRQAPAPKKLGVVETQEGLFITEFDAVGWASYASEVPAARCEPATLEDIFVALTEGSQL